ncbi:MAG: hypothetical protein C3F12_04345 [Candidatus Methylomirabilota bacterium]|nr:helix-turn-helix domain-containing protein [candidate division NC10 bacterium]PWB47213.1 MAG: hypothetical protein C3F12_04345 [candidate division NC10 bacterium]
MSLRALLPSRQKTSQSDLSDLRDDSYLTLQEAASYTRLSVRTLRKWVRHPYRPLPHYKCGGKLLFRRDQIDEWLHGYFFRRSPTAIDVVDAFANHILRELKA